MDGSFILRTSKAAGHLDDIVKLMRNIGDGKIELEGDAIHALAQAIQRVEDDLFVLQDDMEDGVNLGTATPAQVAA